MLGFNRIILSRKGFDSSAGGGFSPFEPHTGKYIVLPIPQDAEESYIGNKLKYEEIKIKNSHFEGYNESNLKELMNRIGSWPPKIKRNNPEYAHFDPWLGSCPWLSKNNDHHMGAFGQVSGAQTILCKNEVVEGSLFLFFSRFKPINWTEVSKFDDIDINHEHIKAGLYFIYGWLRVGKIIQRFDHIHSNLEEMEAKELVRHPHATPEYFEKYEKKRGKNTIYIADKNLFENSTKVDGCGYFTKLSKNLLLTATDSAQEHCSEKWLPSRWKMPPGFSFETCLSYLKDEPKWIRTKDGSYLVQHKGPGQEFVFKGSDEFSQWFKDILLLEMRK